MPDTNLIAQLIAQIQASGQNPSVVLAALSSAYPAPVGPTPDWTDRTMQQWQRIRPNPGGAGDFPNAAQEGMASRDLLNGANPREVINPESEQPIVGNPRVAEGGLPGAGILPGQLFLNPKIAPAVPAGVPRPLAPGEWVQNPGGSWSSEITETIQQGEAPQLNGGRPTIVPTLWIVDGKPVRVDADTAAAYAVRSGLPWRSFDTNEAAEAFSNQRESSWQTLKPEQAGTVEPLWTAPTTNPAQGAVQGMPIAFRQPVAGAVNGTSPLITPVQMNTGIAPDASKFAFDSGPGMQAEDMPTRAMDALGGPGNLTKEQLERYLVARQAGTAAQENMNEARGIPRRFTKPEDAMRYPAY